MGPPQRKIRKVGCPKAKAAWLAAKKAAGDKALSLNADDSDDAGPVPDPNARGSTEVAHDAQPKIEPDTNDDLATAIAASLTEPDDDPGLAAAIAASMDETLVVPPSFPFASNRRVASFIIDVDP